ncbi:MAG: DEAD/DEAH box helicase family protein [Pseudomonadota bacterium]
MAEGGGWAEVGAGAPLRAWQARAVADLQRALAAPGCRVCLVAPPGAGKTRCALHIAAGLELPVEVRVPTTTLVEQWRTRIAQDLVRLGQQAPPIRVATYAADADLAEGALVVLDEAHHLGSAWGQALLDRLRPGHRVLGLTATPPLDSPGWDRFLTLVGEQPVEVDAPPLVRDGQLCPYQDLIWPVLTDADDLPELAAAERALAAAEAEVAEPLGLWVSRRLREDLWALTEARFAHDKGLLVALCRFQRARGFDLPNDLPADPELLARPTLHDRALLLWSFGFEQPGIKAALRAAGFVARGHTLALQDDLGWRALATSHARLRGCLDLLAGERRARGDGLRALVLASRDVEGARLGAREVLRALVSDERTDPLDPILVTGQTFWVDDDLFPRIQARLPDLPWQRVGDHHEVDVAAWPVADRVALATRLLAEGRIRCLVGTHHLLGEGWDCPPVNCVVDLTGIVGAVTVNQVRGRALRPDPGDPSKVASLWEVLVLAPGLAGGERMLERARERHRHTLGLDPQGRIRAGISRIDPRFERSPEALAPEVPALQRAMLARAAEAPAVARRWSVGQAYADRRVWRAATPAAPRGTPTRHRPEKPVPAERSSLTRTRTRRTVTAAGIAVGSAALGIAAAALGAALLGPFGLALGPLAVLPGWGGAALWFAWGRGEAAHRRAVLEALAAALRRIDPSVGRLLLTAEDAQVEGPPAATRRFAEAAAELLGPARYPRYLLLEPDGGAWPVPTELGARRDLADAFAAAWAQHVGPCEVIYARQGRGRELLVALWRAGGRQAVEVVEGWE